MKKLKYAFLAAAVFVLAVASFAAYKPVKNLYESHKEYSSKRFMMDTYVNVDTEGKGCEETAEIIFSQIESLENLCYSRTVEGSDISNLNAEKTYEVEDITLETLKSSLDVCSRSGGALDIGLGSLIDLWNVNSPDAKVPDKADIEKLAGCKYKDISIDGNVITLSSGALIDLGAVAKGAACDKARSIAESSELRKAIVSIGGSVMLYGDDEFSVGIADPQKGSAGYIAKLNLKNCCVSTSGTYERYFESDGVRYHHILDPETGYPVQNGLAEVTVISDSGLLSDALSTACFVLGIENGMKLCEEYGCEAVFVTENKLIYSTDGASGLLTITDDSYSLA